MEETDFLDEELTLSEAAARMGKGLRTVQRMVQLGQLTRLPSGKVPASEVEGLLLDGGGGDAAENTAHVLGELRKSLANAQSHINLTVKLLLESQEQTLDALRQENQRLSAQNADFQNTHLEMVSLVGEVLLKQEERRAIASREESSQAMRAQAFQLFAQMAPDLLSQVKGSSRVQKALGALTDEERGLLEMAVDGMGERGKPLRELLQTGKKAEAKKGEG